MRSELLLVRHGEVEGARTAKRVSGAENPPLSEKGRVSATQIAWRLASEKDITALCTSPLLRAKETADIIGARLNLKPQVVDALREWDFRREMGLGDRLLLLLVTTLSHLAPFRRLLWYQWARSPALQAYVRSVADAAGQIMAAHPGRRIVIVAHGGAIDALLTHYFPEPKQWERGVIRNCSLTRLEVGPGGARLLAFNDCDHLQPVSWPVHLVAAVPKEPM